MHTYDQAYPPPLSWEVSSERNMSGQVHILGKPANQPAGGGGAACKIGKTDRQDSTAQDQVR